MNGWRDPLAFLLRRPASPRVRVKRRDVPLRWRLRDRFDLAAREERLALLSAAAVDLLGYAQRSEVQARAAAPAVSLRASDGTAFALRVTGVSISQNFEFFRGEDVTLNFTVDPMPLSGTIAGWVIKFAMVQCDASGEPLAGAEPLAEITAAVDDPEAGTFHFTIPSAYTATELPGTYRFDCRRQPSGSKATLADGVVTLRREVVA